MATERRDRRTHRAALALTGLVIVAFSFCVALAALLIGVWVWLR
jgi:hypothetical protein